MIWEIAELLALGLHKHTSGGSSTSLKSSNFGFLIIAWVAKLVDALASGASDLRVVLVRVQSRAQN